MKILFSFLLILFAPLANTFALPKDGQTWLGCMPSERFAPLTQLSAPSLCGYRERCIPYLTARGATDDLTWEHLVSQDLLHLAQALSILFEQDATSVLHALLGEHISLIENYSAQIDHVGRELFGPLSFYVPLLREIAPQLGLIHLRDLVFPSTQVVKVLQQHDPSLQGVTIGRVYFQNPNDGRIGCLELFQAAPQDENMPQNLEATQGRLSLLTDSTVYSTITLIDHLSIELNTVEEVQRVHEHIHGLASDTLMPNQQEISYNPGDRSSQTKALLRDSSAAPFNRIVEFVHYAREALCSRKN